jgi:hypothetical protein
MWSLLVWGGLLICLYLVFKSAAPSFRKIEWNLSSILLAELAVLAFYFTWKNMILMTQEDFAKSKFPSWLDWVVGEPAHRSQSLFFEAYRQVTETGSTWYLSGQVLGFVISMVVFMASESHRYSVPISASLVWLGFAVAISVAWPIFLILWQSARAERIRNDVEASTKEKPYMPPPHYWSGIMMISIAISLMCFVMIPRSVNIPPKWHFQAVLVVGHLILILPVMFNRPRAKATKEVTSFAPAQVKPKKHSRFIKSPELSESAVHISVVYGVIAALLWVLHMHAILDHMTDLMEKSPLTFTAQNFSSINGFVTFIGSYFGSLYDVSLGASGSFAQASITWDLVFIHLETWVFICFNTHQNVIAAIVILSNILFFPIQIVFPLYAIYCIWDEHTVYVPETKKVAYDDSDKDE